MMFRGTYTEDWPTLARTVKDAAGWRCIRCGHGHNPAAGRCLTVHHFDGDKANNARHNLMALCQACHLSVQARVNPADPLMFEPAAWAIPYIAGYYESGRGIPGPLYRPEAWRDRYEREVGPWPAWAPVVEPAEPPAPTWQIYESGRWIPCNAWLAAVTATTLGRVRLGEGEAA